MRIGRARLIVGLSLGLLAWSLSADAQQPTKIPRVGVLWDVSPDHMSPQFAEGFRELGYVEGQNIAFEHRFSEGKNDLLPSLAADLVRLQPEVILAVGTAPALAAKLATNTIPIVFTRVADPIGSGLIPSLAWPGGNLTGVSAQTRETSAKRLELLNIALPNVRKVGVVWDPSFPPAGPELGEIKEAARTLDLELVPVEVRGPDDFEPALQAIVKQQAGAVMVVGATLFVEHQRQIIDQIAKVRLPAVYFTAPLVRAGGLMSYAADIGDTIRRAAAYVDKILKGARPADLPVEQPTKFELVINLETAKALGLTIPYTLLGRADEVIE